METAVPSYLNLTSVVNCNAPCMPNLAPKSNGVLINPVETQQQMIDFQALSRIYKLATTTAKSCLDLALSEWSATLMDYINVML